MVYIREAIKILHERDNHSKVEYFTLAGCTLIKEPIIHLKSELTSQNPRKRPGCCGKSIVVMFIFYYAPNKNYLFAKRFNSELVQLSSSVAS